MNRRPRDIVLTGASCSCRLVLLGVGGERLDVGQEVIHPLEHLAALLHVLPQEVEEQEHEGAVVQAGEVGALGTQVLAEGQEGAQVDLAFVRLPCLGT